MRAELIKTQQKLRQQFEENRMQFILTELDTAATFCEVALSSTNAEKTRRNTANAYTAYETALRTAKKSPLRGEAKEEFDRKIGRLRDLLKNLGQQV